MKIFLLITLASIFLAGCSVMKKLDDGIFIEQRTPLLHEQPRTDSLLIIANGSSATQQIMEDIFPLFSAALKERGVSSSSLFISYSDSKIDEAEFDQKKYAYTLWIYEQDRELQQLENAPYLVPLAMKLTDNKNSSNIWIATSVFNNIVRKQFYKEKYAGTLMLLFRANGIIK